MTKPRLFNPKKRKVFRKEIGIAEIVSSCLILIGLMSVIIWVFLQRDHYDPKRQDISIEALVQDSKKTNLYHQPLKAWYPPGSPSSTQIVDLVIFPKEILSDHWTAKSRVKMFNEDNLFEKINGEAESFLKHDFKKLYYLVLQAPDKQEEISIELYDQGSVAGSSGVFSEHRSPQSQIKQSNSNVYFETSIGLIGRKGYFFYRIAGSESSQNIRRKSLQLVKSFSSLPEPKTKMAFGLLLLKAELNIPATEIHHQAVNVFQYDFAKDFWFGKPDKNQKTVLFIHQGTTSQTVVELHKKILDEHQYEYQIIRKSENLVLLQHNFLKTYFVMAHQGTYLFGVDNAPDQKTSFRYLENIGRKLPHEEKK